MNLTKSVYEILAGYKVIKHYGQEYHLKYPSLSDRLEGEIVYDESYLWALDGGFLTEEELFEFSINEGVWSYEKEDSFTALPREIENLKIELYRRCSYISTQSPVEVRYRLRESTEDFERLYVERNMFGYMTANYWANNRRTYFLLAKSLFYKNEEPVFIADVFNDNRDTMEFVLDYLYENKLKDFQYWNITTEDPWRSIWSASKKNGDIFGRPVCELGDEQLILINYSSLYDGIHESPDCPSDDILRDFDCVLGFLLHLKDKRDQEAKKRAIDSKFGDKRGDIMLPARSKEEVRKIYDMNDEQGRGVLKQRFNTIKTKGVAVDTDFKDVRTDLAQKAIQEQMKRR